jgi:hypothetical protein
MFPIRLGTELHLKFQSDGIVSATVKVGDNTLIPSETKSLLKSGKISVKRTSAADFWDAYQHCFASVVLRVARKLHAVYPARLVFVTATQSLLNDATGHGVVQPPLSVLRFLQRRYMGWNSIM